MFSDTGVETFRARVRGLAGFDRIFAVKCLRTRRGGGWAVSDLFLKTARRSAGIIDSRVARVLEADVVDGAAIAVTEFIHGIDLERFRECAQLSGTLATGSDDAALKWQKVVAHIGSEIAYGLGAAHGLIPPLLHGHLCPRNVLISSRAGVKVTDVGLLRAAIQTGDLQPRGDAQYEAPECRGSGPVAAAADIYSLGAILFELCTGEPMVEGKPVDEIQQALENHCPRLAQTILPLLDEAAANRPPAKEAARLLAEVGATLSDGPVVAELTSLVRSFSVFSGSGSIERPNDLLSDAADVQPSGASKLFTIAPTSSTPPVMEIDNDITVQENLSASGSFLRLGDGPTVANDEILPLPPAPAPIKGPAARPVAPGDRRAGTIMSFPVVEAPKPANPPSPLQPLAPLAKDAAPQQSDWAARALAALGDEAGVPVGGGSAPAVKPAVAYRAPAPVVPPEPVPELVPPPVEDAAIAAAFAALPPPPKAPTHSNIAAIEPAQEGQRLEDNLVDDHPDASAFEPPPEDGGASLALADTQFAPPRLSRRDLALSAEIRAIDDEESARAMDADMEPVSAPATTPPPRRTTTKGVPVRKSAKLGAQAAVDPIIDELPGHRNRNIFLGVLAVLVIGGFVGGGAGLLVTKDGKDAKVAESATPAPAKTTPAATAPTAIAPATPPVAKPIAQPIAKPIAPAGKPTPVAKPMVPAATPAPVAKTETFAKDLRPPKGPAVAITITSQPEGATVWLAGQERGKTPLSVREKSGAAALVLVKEGHASVRKTIQIAEGGKFAESLVRVSAPMDGDARFRAECGTPGKFPIVVDGKETGMICPYSKMKVAPGPHRIGILIPATGSVREKEITLSKGVRSVSFPD